MNMHIFDRVIKALCGAAAAALVIPFVAFPVSADSYSGITIDGDFSDWDSVVKYDAWNDPYQPTVNDAAIVWDGDWIYLYINEVQDHSSNWAGPNHNGNFVIETDIGETLVVALSRIDNGGNHVEVTNPKTDLYLSDTNGGIQIAQNSDYLTWEAPSLIEIAIPSSALPDYSSTINFGFYLGENFVEGVADCSQTIIVDPDDPTPIPTEAPYNDGSGIVIDGDYHDWDYFPVTTIEYDTAGMMKNFCDAKGSILSRDGLAYVHATTNYFETQDTGFCDGSEFLEVTVWINDYTFTMLKAVKIYDDGSLDWKEEYNPQAPGSHHFALFYSGDSELSKNINDILPSDTYLGDMYIEVGDYQNQTEFWFDVAKLAERAGIPYSETQHIDVQFHRIGDEKLRASGISTGPVFVLALSALAAGSYFTYNRRKKAE